MDEAHCASHTLLTSGVIQPAIGKTGVSSAALREGCGRLDAHRLGVHGVVVVHSALDGLDTALYSCTAAALCFTSTISILTNLSRCCLSAVLRGWGATHQRRTSGTDVSDEATSVNRFAVLQLHC